MKTFEQLQLADFIQKAILDLGFTTPSEVQSESIPHLMEGSDIIAMAPTGSGKTVAYAVPALQKIDAENNRIQALVLSPTRELTMQVHKEIEKLTKYNEDIKIVSIYGGQRIERQLDALKNRKPQIVIATPGRLMDHLKRGSIKLDNIKYVVLDEADEMLDMGFRDDISKILEDTNSERQTVLFSATMEKDIMNLAKKFQKNPVILNVVDNSVNAPDIEQSYFEISEREKPELTARLLDLHNVNLAVVFCNTKSNVDMLVEKLKVRGFSTDALHGDMNQGQREKVMRGFKNGALKVLVATDVAGRGIDVKDVEAVFNYDLPRDDEDYVHRIGRTARAGSSGKAFSFITRSQFSMLRKIERKNGFKISKSERPTIEEIDNSRLNNYENIIKNTIDSADLTEFKAKIAAFTNENQSELDVAAALFKMMVDKEKSKVNREMVFEENSFNESDDFKSGNRRGGRSSGRFDRSRGGSRGGGYKREDSRGGGEGRANDYRGGGQKRDDFRSGENRGKDFRGGASSSPFGSRRNNSGSKRSSFKPAGV